MDYYNTLRVKWMTVTPVLLPGKTPWMEEPGRLQSMGSQRVRHDWSNSVAIYIYKYIYEDFLKPTLWACYIYPFHKIFIELLNFLSYTIQIPSFYHELYKGGNLRGGWPQETWSISLNLYTVK